MTEPKKNYVNGEWFASQTGETVGVQNPANPSETVARSQESDEEDDR